ncbi:LysR Transcriptional regulator [Paracoccaceae bacterium]|jgi:LysR family glycine cleavage system transcriptional activator
MPNLRQTLPPMVSLAAFEAVCRHFSFTRAAVELNLSQSAISQQIRSLERDLGQPLFERHRHDVTLTPAGRVYAENIEPALRVISDASVSLRAGPAPGRLLVFTDLCLAAYWLVPRLGRFQAPEREVDIKVLTSARPFHLQSEPAHLAIQYGGPLRAGYALAASFADRVIAVCSPAFRATMPSRVSLKDLTETALIHLDQPGRDWTDWPGFLGAQGLGWRPEKRRLEFSAHSHAVEAAIQGQGVALAWSHSIRDLLVQGRLLAVEDFAISSPQDLCIQVRQDATALIQEFITWLEVELQGSAAAQARLP